MTDPREDNDARAAYAVWLKERLRNRVLAGLAAPYSLPIPVRPVLSRDRDDKTSLDRLLTADGEKRILLIGNPGAGKTTLLSDAARVCLEDDRCPFPVFVDLRRYRAPEHTLERLIARETEGFGGLEGLAHGREVLYLLDGLNEVPERQLLTALDDIEEWASHDRSNSNLRVITCRTIDFPAEYRTTFARYEVCPVTPEVALRYLGDALGDHASAASLYSSVSAHVRGLLVSPLLLNMFAFIARASLHGRRLPGNRADLYRQFLDRLAERTRAERFLETPEDLREECHAWIAWELQNQRLELPLRDAQHTARQFHHREPTLPITAFLREVLDYPPMGAADASAGGGATRAFMHQSFQEYFTARYMLRQIEEGEDLDVYTFSFTSAAVEWRETLVHLAGMVENATELVTHAVEQTNFDLACRIIEEARGVDEAVVDDVTVRVLDTFKYDGFFDYALIFGLRRMRARQSASFPERVTEDIDHWVAKYARNEPREIAASVSSTKLIRLAQEGALHERLDAIATLGARSVTDAVAMLGKLAVGDESDEVREQAMIALGKIGAPISIELLHRLAANPVELDILRAYALNALHAFPTEGNVLFLVRYLTGDGPYKDSATWALSAIAQANPDLVSPRVPELLAALETDIDRYAKGTVLLTLSRLPPDSVIEGILGHAESERDPYVIEDTCNALGLLRSPRAVDFLTRTAAGETTKDPIVRRHAVLALGAIGTDDATTAVARLPEPSELYVMRARQAVLRDAGIATPEAPDSADNALVQEVRTTLAGARRSGARRICVYASKSAGAWMLEAAHTLHAAGELRYLPLEMSAGKDKVELRMTEDTLSVLRRHFGSEEEGR